MQSIERIPPQDLDAERATLGSVLIDKTSMATLLECYGPAEPHELYQAEAHRLIYEAYIGLTEVDEPIDGTTLKGELVKRRTLEAVGGLAYCADLLSAVPDTSNLEHYAKIVLEMAIRRGCISAGHQFTMAAWDPATPIAEVLAEGEQRIYHLANHAAGRSVVNLRDMVAEGVERLTQMSAAKGAGVYGRPTGYTHLDQLLGGFQPGDLIVVASRPAIGKTSLGLNIASNIARKGGRIAFMSLEMDRNDIFDRLTGIVCGVDIGKLRKGFLGNKELELLGSKVPKLESMDFIIDDTPNPLILNLVSRVVQMNAVKQLDLIVVDYLQLMTTSGKRENRQVEVSDMTRSMKQLARKTRCPVVLMAQLNREAEQSGAPQLHHLRESGAIEQDADIVIMLNRTNEAFDYHHEIDLLVQKHRKGQCGIVKIILNKNLQRILEADEHNKQQEDPLDPEDEQLF